MTQWRWIAAGLAGLVLGLHGAAAMAETRTLRGTVTYRERMALPPSAVVEVKLVDISLADAPSRTIAEMTKTGPGQVPIPYELRFDSAEILPRHSYALQARITVDGRLWFITTTRHSVFAGGADSTEIRVERVGDTGAVSPAAPTGRWLAENIDSGGVIDRLQTVLEIAADGSVSGSGGCNRMAGKATIAGDRISFGPIASTNMACVPAAMDQEQKFFAALRRAQSWSFNAAMQKLTLRDADGKPIVVFSRM
ncbi:MAG: YbaY family lipoprotein [Proteobacteria bacterium]|nr:YbaY family lipoprotein [Pseudomonadota bacterium]